MAFIANLFNAHSGLEVVENLEILEESREEKCIHLLPQVLSNKHDPS
jgi:hypothetical protein